MGVIVLTDANFKEEVETYKDMPVLIDFWAPWCGPCKTIGPLIEKMAEQYKGKVKIGKLDVDENPTISTQFGVMSIPTLLFFKKGEVIKSLIGVQGEEALRHELDSLLSSQ